MSNGRDKGNERVLLVKSIKAKAVLIFSIWEHPPPPPPANSVSLSPLASILGCCIKTSIFIGCALTFCVTDMKKKSILTFLLLFKKKLEPILD